MVRSGVFLLGRRGERAASPQDLPPGSASAVRGVLGSRALPERQGGFIGVGEPSFSPAAFPDRSGRKKAPLKPGLFRPARPNLHLHKVISKIQTARPAPAVSWTPAKKGLAAMGGLDF